MRNLLFLILFAVIVSCSSQKQNNKQILFVSILPEKYFVEQIADTMFDINVMVEKGKNPAIYEPTPMQMKKLSKAKAFFTIGAPYEKKWIPKLQKIYPDLKIIKIDSGIEKIPMENPFDIKTDSILNLDPHIWLAPELVKIQIKNIYNTLVQISPRNKDFFDKNYRDFIEKIDSLQRYINERLANIKNRSFIVFHPSWGYFAKEFNLKQIPVEIEGKSPSAKELGNIINFAKQHKLHTILIAPQFSKKELQIIAKQIDGKIVEADPLAYNWLQNLKNIADKLSDE